MHSCRSEKSAIFALILIFFCIVSYSNVFQNGFLLDDYSSFIDKGSLPSVPIFDLFAQGYKNQYRPICLLLLKFEVYLFGMNPIGYHLCNLLLFYGICLSFFYVLRRITKNQELALLTACLYTVHPALNIFLNYKSAGPISLYVLFMLISTIGMLTFTDSGKKKFYWISLAFYFFSLLSHEISFIFPLYLFLILFFYGSVRLKRNALLCLSYLPVFLIYLLMRNSAQGTKAFDFPDLSFHQYASQLTSLIGWYWGKLIVPINFIFIWDQPISSQANVLGNILILAGLIALTVFCFQKKRSPICFGLMLFLSGFIPLAAASFVYTTITRTAIIEPHWFGFSSIGFFLCAACLLYSLRKFINKKAWLILITTIFLGLSLLTRHNNTFWKDEATYCRYWLKLNPWNWTPWTSRARAFIVTHDRGMDPRNYNDCTEITDLAGAYLIAGQLEIAKAFYASALKADPGCHLPFPDFNLIYPYLHNDNHEAKLFFYQTIRFEPGYSRAYQTVMHLQKIKLHPIDR